MIFNPFALTAFREIRDLSKVGLARADSTSPSYVTQLEQGTRANPSIETIENLAGGLGVDPRALYVDPTIPQLIGELEVKAGGGRGLIDVAIEVLNSVRVPS